MLKLKNIVKTYPAEPNPVTALKGIDLEFRKNEFVSILGPSGCGKTTLLNIIGGLDQYTSGDLVIRSTSTKNFRDPDWDSYRNHSVGFVFQSYNLIPHQTVLSNVELALTLSGVSKAERRRRAKEVLERVGLGDQLNKKPNQMSGGQMQRVAIARALINDPEILLADEPTGALDSVTSEQVMELLKEIASDRLVIMVTHNPELAERYSTRIVRLLDGEVVSDTNPFDPAEEKADQREKYKKPTMSFFTALSLSINNLLTKKTRTILTAFAGSIGIIGIALILSLSNGLQTYIDRVEKDTLSSYPITIQQESIDLSSFMSTSEGDTSAAEERPLDRIYTNTMMAEMVNTMMSKVESNDLGAFKTYIEENDEKFAPLTTAISYSYSVPLNLWYRNTDGKLIQVNPSRVFENMGYSNDMMSMAGSFGSTGSNMWTELIDNREFLETQYDIVAGKWPENKNEAVLIVGENNDIPDLVLYSLGIKDPEEVADIMKSLASGEQVDSASMELTYDEVMSLEYSLLLPTDVYEKTEAGWVDRADDSEYIDARCESAEKIKICGIIRKNPDAVAASAGGYIGYTAELTEYIVNAINDSEIVREQTDNPETDVFTGIKFEGEEPKTYTMEELTAYIAASSDEDREKANAAIEQMRAAGMTDEAIAEMLSKNMPAQTTSATYDGNIKKLGVCDLSKPSQINIYAADFDAKESIAQLISEYNDSVSEEYTITYTDYIGLLLSSVTTVINAISYILIAFVSISLVVSSIMIGIITYISVLERTKEIGILRSIGASKRDISRVFNAETVTIGFIAGALGIIVTVLLCIPANAIIKNLTGISNVALLPAAGAAALVIISMLLTFVAGLIPSRIAANKDPVVALRTE